MIKDWRLLPRVSGVGFVGIGEHRADSKEYTRWKNMIRRCYDPSHWVKYPAYKGCTVTREWLNFQTFAEWAVRQSIPRGWHMDKDVLVPGNRVYSPATVCIIPGELNTLLGNRAAARGEFLLGVYKRPNGRYLARVREAGRSKNLGTFGTEMEAHIAYLEEKPNVIRRTAERLRPLLAENVYRALMENNYAEVS